MSDPLKLHQRALALEAEIQAINQALGHDAPRPEVNPHRALLMAAFIQRHRGGCTAAAIFGHLRHYGDTASNAQLCLDLSSLRPEGFWRDDTTGTWYRPEPTKQPARPDRRNP